MPQDPQIATWVNLSTFRFGLRRPARSQAGTMLLLLSAALAIIVSALPTGGWSWLKARSGAATTTVTLDREMTAAFPVLRESLTPGGATISFVQATEMVGGHTVSGLRALAQTSTATRRTGQTGAAAQRPEEAAALSALANRGERAAGALQTFFPQRYTDSFVVEGGGVRAAVRAFGAEAAEANVENGRVVYRGAYRETDSLHAVGGSRSEEYLYVRSPRAPRRFDYELSGVTGACEVSLGEGAVRFRGEGGQGLEIEAPWVVDASGERRDGVARWELGEAGADGKRILSLVVTQGAELKYPLVIDPSWSLTGSLSVNHTHHTATLLQNGKVLVAGGSSSSNILSSAELYDPATGIWSLTGSLNTARAGHTATLLPSGKVLVAGGGNDAAANGVLASAEIYDPATGAWTATGSLNTARTLHTATLLKNGQVLVAGGFGLGPASAELYDPATGVWTATGSLSETRSEGFTATLLPNGKVLVAGGINNRGAHISSAEVYDPATGTWSATGSLIGNRANHSATLLPNGKVMVTGGVFGGIGNIPLNSTQLYDPSTGTWSGVANLNSGRYSHTATLLPSGKVLVVGGSGTGFNTAEVFDYSTGVWSATGSLNTYRHSHTATLLPNGKVLVVGGQSDSASVSAELYDPATGTWSVTGSLNTARQYHTATLLSDGRVLVAGGDNGDRNTALTSAEIYDPSTGVWSVTGPLNEPRSGHTATLLRNGKVLVAGGSNLTNYSFNGAEVYDPSTGTWSVTGSLYTPRFGNTATLLPNGKVLVAGGGAEVYDPATGSWLLSNYLNVNRVYHTATLLPNGKVLVAGGLGEDSTSAELYDPATGVWTMTGPLNAARAHHTATLLPDGRVLVAGGNTGEGSNSLSSAEIYDPATGTWSMTGSLNTARDRHTATLLPDGRVLVAGGAGGGIHASTELYDVGLGFAPSSRPVISGATSPLTLGGKLTLSGSGFQGVSASSSDNNQSSPANYPVVQLRSLVNDQTLFLPSDPATSWSDTSFTSQAVTNFPTGYALVTVFVNGIPSSARLIQVSQPAGPGFNFDSASYSFYEADGHAAVTINRNDDSSAPAAVAYATSDAAGLQNCNVTGGVASSRCDYTTATGTLSFAAGETAKTILIPLVDDAYAEGPESFTISLSSAQGETLGTVSSATITINDNETSDRANPISGAAFFIRQQYIDFLGREPDPAGYAAWQNILNNCAAGDTSCDRIAVSSGFFRSPEFQTRGYFIYKFYSAALGRKPNYSEFIPDLGRVSGFLSDAQLEANKVAFVSEFMTRPEYTNRYGSLGNAAFVDTLVQTAGLQSHLLRDAWVGLLNNGSATKAEVLRAFTESLEVYNRFYNEAFVVMQYFGYLRRDPDASYLQWIQTLNSNGGDYRAMISGFINSNEYVLRFGP